MFAVKPQLSSMYMVYEVDVDSKDRVASWSLTGNGIMS